MEQYTDPEVYNKMVKRFNADFAKMHICRNNQKKIIMAKNLLAKAMELDRVKATLEPGIEIRVQIEEIKKPTSKILIPI